MALIICGSGFIETLLFTDFKVLSDKLLSVQF